jgi:uncharacterized protein YcfL
LQRIQYVGIESHISQPLQFYSATLPTITILGDDDAVFLTASKIGIEDENYRQKVTLKCTVAGFPPPTLHEWHFVPASSGDAIEQLWQENENGEHESTIVADSFVQSTSVHCSATNRIGTSDSQPVVVTVKGAGTPPTHVAHTVDQNQVRVTWTPPEVINGVVDKYVLYVRDKNGVEQRTTTANESVTLDLEPDTAYTIRLTSVVDGVEGPAHEMHVQTAFKCNYVHMSYHN